MRVVIEIEGGCLTAISADKDVTFYVVDYDNAKDVSPEDLQDWGPSKCVADAIGRGAVDNALKRAEEYKQERMTK